MRYLPKILQGLFKPVLPMDASEEPHEAAFDQITRDIDAAVLEHEETAVRMRESRERGLQATFNELLDRLGQPH